MYPKNKPLKQWKWWRWVPCVKGINMFTWVHMYPHVLLRGIKEWRRVLKRPFKMAVLWQCAIVRPRTSPYSLIPIHTCPFVRKPPKMLQVGQKTTCDDLFNQPIFKFVHFTKTFVNFLFCACWVVCTRMYKQIAYGYLIAIYCVWQK